MGTALVYANPNNWKQKQFLDPGSVSRGTIVPTPGYVLQSAFDGSIDTSLNPPEHDVPVFTGGWPAYNNGPQQLGFTKGSRGGEGPNG